MAKTKAKKSKSVVQEEEVIPSNFSKVITDFVADLTTTFPEYKPIIDSWWSPINEHNVDLSGSLGQNAVHDEQIVSVFKHCKRIFPERMFDILYKNTHMFDLDSGLNTEFLPGIQFKTIFICPDISDHTRDAIWKYLQLVLMVVIGEVKSMSDFGNSANMFDLVNNDELRNQFQKTIDHLQETMNTESWMKVDSQNGVQDPNVADDAAQLPNASAISDHLSELMKGKIGLMAKEFSDEIAEELDLQEENAGTTEILKQLFTNPTKLMEIMKRIGGKIQTKIQSGEIKQSELLEEAQEMLGRMKDIPGLKEMMSKMMGGGKVSEGAMKYRMEKEMKIAKTRERMLEKLKRKQAAEEAVAANAMLNETADALATQTPEELKRAQEDVIALFEQKPKKQEKSKRKK